MSGRMRRSTSQRGFSYLLLLFAVAALGIASAGSALMWSTLAQTERERELLFIGGEFSRALQRYFDASPAEPKRYPATLQDLLEDKRQPTPLRHLRKLYFDPMTRSQDWGLVISGGQIRAVYSKSEQPARITLLPAWVDATGDKVASSLKNAAPAPGAVVSPTALNAAPTATAQFVGQVRLIRGTLGLAGRRFRLDDGTVIFAGARPSFRAVASRMRALA